MRIVTSYWAKPIGDRSADWAAYDDESYDGEGCAIGFGLTREAAIADLVEQIQPDTSPPLPALSA